MSYMKAVYSDIIEMLEADCSGVYIASNIARDYDIPLRDAYSLMDEVRVAFELDMQETADCLE